MVTHPSANMAYCSFKKQKKKWSLEVRGLIELVFNKTQDTLQNEN